MNKWMRLGFLILGGGMIFKIMSLRVIFYGPMQEAWGLSNAQIGFTSTIGTIVQFAGLFLSLWLSISDRFSKKYLLPIGLIGMACCGAYLATIPPLIGFFISFALIGFFADVIYWPVVIKSIRLLGDDNEQGRLFGYFESGRGIIDVAVSFGALAAFSYFGEGLTGLKAGIWFFTIMNLVIGIVTYFVIDDDDAKMRVESDNKDEGRSNFNGIMFLIKDVNLWLALFNIFFIYSAYCGLTYFIPFLKDIYALPVALVGTYGIINQYGLKIISGAVAGNIADKIFKSSTKCLMWAGVLFSLCLFGFTLLPHESMNVYVGMAATLITATFIFIQRGIYFAPINDIGAPREYAGTASTLGCMIGYFPAMFTYPIFGWIIDTYEGITGYNYIFYIMITFSIISVILSGIILKRLEKKKSLEFSKTTA